MLCDEFELHLTNGFKSFVFTKRMCSLSSVGSLSAFLLQPFNEFSCILTTDTALYGDYVACGAIHWTGLAEKSEPTLPPT